MSEHKDIYEKIDLTIEEFNNCWNYNCVNEMCDFTPPETVLKDIISDNELSIGQKVYLTWIYASTLEKRKELKCIEEGVQ